MNHLKKIKYLTTMKLIRPEWAGHMNNDGITSNVFLRKPAGERTAGRPKLRWLEVPRMI
jgi:hypothetical protein